MQRVIVSDTSCLILLNKIGKISLLKSLFGKITLTSAIALALEKEDCLLIIDESKGRREAKLLGINCTGTLGILIVAKEKGLINSASDVLDQIKQTNFRISDVLVQETKRRCGE